MEILTSAEAIFDNGNKHMSTKFRFLGKAEQSVISYIISKLRKYHGSFFEKYKGIAEELEISTKTIQRAVKHAEQLGIFQVSERFEPTLDGKMRKTTNLIQMLAYKPFEMVNGILSVVRKVRKAVKLIDVAQKIMTAAKPAMKEDKSKSSHKSSPKSKHTYNKKPIRTEIIPDWFNELEEEKKPLSVEEQMAFDEKTNQLKESFAKLGIKWKE